MTSFQSLCPFTWALRHPPFPFTHECCTMATESGINLFEFSASTHVPFALWGTCPKAFTTCWGACHVPGAMWDSWILHKQGIFLKLNDFFHFCELQRSYLWNDYVLLWTHSHCRKCFTAPKLSELRYTTHHKTMLTTCLIHCKDLISIWS